MERAAGSGTTSAATVGGALLARAGDASAATRGGVLASPDLFFLERVFFKRSAGGGAALSTTEGGTSSDFFFFSLMGLGGWQWCHSDWGVYSFFEVGLRLQVPRGHHFVQIDVGEGIQVTLFCGDCG